MTLHIDDNARFDRLPPHSLEAEMCLLASMMLDREFATEAVGAASSGAFYLTDHKIMFDAIASLVTRDRPVDAVILRDELKRMDELDRIGGSAYIAKILSTVPSAAHGREYLARVVESAGRRALISLADTLTRSAYSGAQSFSEIAEPAMQTLLNLVSRGSADQVIAMSRAVEDFVIDYDKGQLPFIPTGLVALDDEIGGVRLGCLTIIGARPSVGKTLVAKQIARNMASKGIRVGFVTIEENRGKIVENYASAITHIDNRIIANRALSAVQRDQVGDALKELADLPIFLADSVSRLDEIVGAVTTMKIRHKCDVVIVDHLHLIGVDSDANRVDQIRVISGTLKSTFKRLGVGGIVLCQLNREGNERPTLRSLREGGSLEQDGDVIIMLHSEDYHRKQRGEPLRDHKLEFLLQKNKGGRCADIPFYLDAAHFTVAEWEEEVSRQNEEAVEARMFG